MSIKPDHWIRRMALEHGMIEPFVENQVRVGVISYGVSSFGYDIRVANEFRIFTPATGQLTVVDPKAIDERAMVHYSGEVCIIPPNSFALARTVEYFRIPRNVLTICLGKCVTGDTRIVDAETGAYLPISEAVGLNRTVGLNDWRMGKFGVSHFVPNGVKPVYKLQTKTGLQICATANHPFRQLAGWTNLSDLKPGDRIAVVREIPVFGKTVLPDWEATLLGLMISEGQCDTPGYSPVYTTNDAMMAQVLKTCVRDGLNGEVTYNGDFGYRLVNRAGRGGIMTNNPNRAAQWLHSYGLDVKASEKFVPQAIFKAPREQVVLFLRALFSGDGSIYLSGKSAFVEYYSNSRRLIEDVHHLLLRFGIVSLIRERQTQINTAAYRIQITDLDEISKFIQRIGFWPGSHKQIRTDEELLPFLMQNPHRKRSNFDTLPSTAWQLLNQASKKHNVSLRSIGIAHTAPKQSLPYTIAKTVAEFTQDDELSALVQGPLWDTVASIEYAGEEEVFDLTVCDVHNFLANDMIVHNSTYARCGIIVNVTPFEPEWEGHVTIEISNTTPLPAKIYAHEGIAQVIFFEGEQPEVSYADRKGKYQAQRGITLPRL
jgi:deoxycytidine triphosphate deaminase